MNKLIISLLSVSILAACGGGGGGTSTPAPAGPSAQGSAPAQNQPAPAPAAPATASETPPAPAGVNYRVRTMSTSTQAGQGTVVFSETTQFTLTGDLNRFWLTATQPGGFIKIFGNSNTIVLNPGTTPDPVTVEGAANVFYLPAGSPVKLTGSGAAQSTIKYYQP